MRIYIAGPMTGMPDFNRPAFNAAANALRDAGIDVCNPAETPQLPETTWKEFMQSGIQQLVHCDGIFMLEGWEKSKGAKLERHIAGELGLPISFQKKKKEKKEGLFGQALEEFNTRQKEIEAKQKAEAKVAIAAKAADEEEAAIRRIASMLGLGKLCDCGNPDCPNSGLDVKIFRL